MEEPGSRYEYPDRKLRMILDWIGYWLEADDGERQGGGYPE